jgi:hypothetical protein
VELFNKSPDLTIDLSGWMVSGIDYTFPAGATLAPGKFLLLVQNRPVFTSVYGAVAAAGVYDEFPGILRDDGDILTLWRPGSQGLEIVNQVRYEAQAPWPLGAHQGAALQLVDAARDNSRVANWAVSGWRFASYTGTNFIPVGSPILMLLPQSAGDVYIDDLVVVPGTNAGVGGNVITNGGFESPLAGTWFVGTNLASSAIVSNVKHSGSSCLLLRAATPGTSAFTSINQTNLAFAGSNVFTLSFWYLPVSLSNIVIRTASLFRPNFYVAPASGTPGTTNSVLRILPELPPVWLNEVLPQNVTSIIDNFGEHDPWVELYNSGTNGVDLTGWYLANNYTNLAQWAFPAGTVINPGEFKVIWADGQPAQIQGTNLHTMRIPGAVGR